MVDGKYRDPRNGCDDTNSRRQHCHSGLTRRDAVHHFPQFTTAAMNDPRRDKPEHENQETGSGQRHAGQNAFCLVECSGRQLSHLISGRKKL